MRHELRLLSEDAFKCDEAKDDDNSYCGVGMYEGSDGASTGCRCGNGADSLGDGRHSQPASQPAGTAVAPSPISALPRFLQSW